MSERHKSPRQRTAPEHSPSPASMERLHLFSDRARASFGTSDRGGCATAWHTKETEKREMREGGRGANEPGIYASKQTERDGHCVEYAYTGTGSSREPTSRPEISPIVAIRQEQVSPPIFRRYRRHNTMKSRPRVMQAGVEGSQHCYIKCCQAQWTMDSGQSFFQSSMRVVMY
ncbi:hypothetical protein LX36DRAFT_236453 [Colletotrichum falcatum]|nr:hypothetical protein LX36DRAFT_236453 [Colletotrichum falcatum]